MNANVILTGLSTEMAKANPHPSGQIKLLTISWRVELPAGSGAAQTRQLQKQQRTNAPSRGYSAHSMPGEDKQSMGPAGPLPNALKHWVWEGTTV